LIDKRRIIVIVIVIVIEMATNKGGGGEGGGIFLTQKAEKITEIKKEIDELEELLQGVSQTSQSTLLLKKRKEMREVDEALEITKKDYKKRIEECEERRMLFEAKQSKMREQVLRFERFIQENDAKRVRAEAKIKAEKALFQEKCREIQQLSEKLEALEQLQKAQMQDLIRRSCYKAYLEQIVEEKGDQGYEEISDVLNRHRSLVEANEDLMTSSTKLEKQVDELSRKLSTMKTEKQNTLLVINSVYQENQHVLESMKEKVKIEERAKNYDEDKTKEVSKELSQVASAIKNVFTRCQSSSRNRVKIGSTNAPLSEVLDFNIEVILARVVDLIEITKEYNEEQVYNLGGSINDLTQLSGSTILTQQQGLQNSSKSQII